MVFAKGAVTRCRIRFSENLAQNRNSRSKSSAWESIVAFSTYVSQLFFVLARRAVYSDHVSRDRTKNGAIERVRELAERLFLVWKYRHSYESVFTCGRTKTSMTLKEEKSRDRERARGLDSRGAYNVYCAVRGLRPAFRVR